MILIGYRCFQECTSSSLRDELIWREICWKFDYKFECCRECEMWKWKTFRKTIMRGKRAIVWTMANVDSSIWKDAPRSAINHYHRAYQKKSFSLLPPPHTEASRKRSISSSPTDSSLDLNNVGSNSLTGNGSQETAPQLPDKKIKAAVTKSFFLIFDRMGGGIVAQGQCGSKIVFCISKKKWEWN